MARLAILLHQGDPEKEQALLGRALEFLGVPWKSISVAGFCDVDSESEEQVVFGSASCIARVFEHAGTIERCLERATVFYAYADPNRAEAQRGIRQLLGSSRVKIRDGTEGIVRVEVFSGFDATAGAMAGICANLRMRKEDASLAGIEEQADKTEALISADGAPIFVRTRHAGILIYLCASSYLIDIEQEIDGGYYDIKEHFCSAVPLLLFIRLMFNQVAWQPQEIGACLIIDDPLLQRRYGCCNFDNLRKLMRELEFSTNIAFIPWNWWRTSRTASDLFDRGAGPFSVSIHGCDHVKAEFGDSSANLLYGRARLAQARMRRHQNRTGIRHEPVMVFPQGVFSSGCPAVLKRSGYVAAVNTEISPVDRSEGGTRIRDAWDVAIMKYGDFAIFTRRYAHHGMENFAFDMLLGKPCFIVAHHEFFRNGNSALIQLLEGLRARNCRLQWQTLGAVIRKACRRRCVGPGAEEIRMYASELSVNHRGDQALHVHIRKPEHDLAEIQDVRCGQTCMPWQAEADDIGFDATIAPQSESAFSVSYRAPEQAMAYSATGTANSRVAARRILSEVRDACVGKYASVRSRSKN